MVVAISGPTGAVRHRLRRALVGSVLYGLIRGLFAALPLHRGDEAGGSIEFLRCSWLARWFTTEPNPDVIVIDLREVRLVRPFLFTLDYVLGMLANATVYSRIGSGIYRTGSAIARAPVRALGIVLLLVAGGGFVLTLPEDPPIVLIGGFGVLALVGLLALFETRSWGELRETRPIGWLASVFSPPEPPEQNRDR